MSDKEFVEWFRGFVDGAHHFNITPAQWDYLKEKLKEVETKNTLANYSLGNWNLNHTWE
jgi:hypothetical protein